jgi:hypothetical protein
VGGREGDELMEQGKGFTVDRRVIAESALLKRTGIQHCMKKNHTLSSVYLKVLSSEVDPAKIRFIG